MPPARASLGRAGAKQQGPDDAGAPFFHSAF